MSLHKYYSYTCQNLKIHLLNISIHPKSWNFHHQFALRTPSFCRFCFSVQKNLLYLHGNWVFLDTFLTEHFQLQFQLKLFEGWSVMLNKWYESYFLLIFYVFFYFQKHQQLIVLKQFSDIPSTLLLERLKMTNSCSVGDNDIPSFILRQLN